MHTEKQKRFIDFYIETGNATEAARLAGYKQPQVQGHQNLEKLRDTIDEKLAAKNDERVAKGDEVLRFLSSVMRGEVTEDTLIFVGKGMQELQDKGASVRDRTEAAKQLAKRYGLDRSETEQGTAQYSQMAEFIQIVRTPLPGHKINTDEDDE